VAGHHAVVGAAIGCAVGHHRAKAKEKQATQAQAAPPSPPSITVNHGAVDGGW
jgi:hypothetical protein